MRTKLEHIYSEGKEGGEQMERYSYKGMNRRWKEKRKWPKHPRKKKKSTTCIVNNSADFPIER